MNAPAPHSRTPRRAGVRFSLVLGLLLALAPTSQALAGGLDSPRFAAPAARLGISFLDVSLPLSFRGRVQGFYSRTRNAIDGWAYNRFTRPGPALRRSPTVEGRVALARPVGKGVELEVAWSTRGQFADTDAPFVDRQVVGAFFRFEH